MKKTDTRLTNSSDETEINRLLQGNIIFTIPYFQRAYKWGPPEVNRLNEDIVKIVDNNDSHFFGAMIVHGRPNNPADPKPYDIIDGQQRLTTLILYLCATVKILCKEKQYNRAVNIFTTFLVITRSGIEGTSLSSNLKLHPCKDDRKQMNLVYEDIMKSKKFESMIAGFVPKYLPSTGNAKGPLKNNYNSIYRFLTKQLTSSGIDRINNIYDAILGLISVVQIDVNDPTHGPKIFNGLNSQQKPMSVGDLVRNEVFSRVASEESQIIDEIDESEWRPFYNKFTDGPKNIFDAYFFPFGLIHNDNIKKSEVFVSLRTAWAVEQNPSNIIVKLKEFQNAFIDIVHGSNLQEHDKDISQAFRNLTLSGIPSSTYPFLMRLSNELQNKKVSKSDGLKVLSLVDSFLTRRAVCGHEPTGLHAVFKKLWNDCNGVPTLESVSNAIRKHKTVVWPTDEEFSNAIIKRKLYQSAITNYFLHQYDISLGGDHPNGQAPWIEHILPQKMSDKDWTKDFTQDDHAKYSDTLANLLPLSAKMNRELSNKSFDKKRPKFIEDSMFKSTRDFAKKFSTWTPKDIEQRSQGLYEWALKRWPM